MATINVFNVKSNYSKHGFDNNYLELIITEMDSNGEKTDNEFVELLEYNDQTKMLWDYLTSLDNPDTDVNSINNIMLNSVDGENEYVFNVTAQMSLGMEMFSFVWDMKHQTFTPILDDNTSSVAN